jgi:hypothetical protein
MVEMETVWTMKGKKVGEKKKLLFFFFSNQNVANNSIT